MILLLRIDNLIFLKSVLLRKVLIMKYFPVIVI